MDELLRVNNLKKYFPVTKGILKKEVASVKAVDGVSFEIRRGETFGLVGESGCGKTTVGKLILRLLDATKGEVIFDGRDLQTLSKTEMREMRKEIQIIFQDPYGSLNPRMTVYEIIAEPIRKHKLASGEELTRRVADLLNRVGLSEREMRKYPHEFSGGQRQRICIARALAVNPRLIVCDEPVSALDVSVQSQILNLLKDLQRDLGVAYLFIAHGMPAVRHMSDRVGVMYLGSLVEVADCKDLFSNQLHPYSKALISAIPVADPDHKPKRIVLEGDVPNPISLNPGCRFYSRCSSACERCKNDPPELREVLPGHYVACHLVKAK